MTVQVPVVVLPHGEGLVLPQYATPASSGMDLLAAVVDSIHLAPLQRTLVPTGITCAIPAGWEGQVRPRSGLALKHGITCLNSPGTIDADYRGEIGVILINLGDTVFVVERGMRIAQLVFAKVEQMVWDPQAALEKTGRGSGGFGSTGR